MKLAIHIYDVSNLISKETDRRIFFVSIIIFSYSTSTDHNKYTNEMSGLKNEQNSF